ncbi:MAG: hypothetical protein ACM3ML_35895 [Micromonosporaceae bacterium]
MHTTFTETMTGQARLAGEERPRTALLDLAADVPEVLRPWADVEAAVTGRVRVDGFADDQAAAGTLRIAPLTARRIRYQLDFTAWDGRRMHLDGWKSVSFARPIHSMTTLPATITDEKGGIVGETLLRFDLRRSLGQMLASFRLRGGLAWEATDRPMGARRRSPSAAQKYLAPRWRGQPGRLEVWYTTLTDPATGTGFWLHHELVAPTDGSEPYAHGWAAVFAPDSAPTLARFGPQQWHAAADGTIFATRDVVMRPLTARGTAGGPGTGEEPSLISWDLTAEGGGPPLFTFPRWAWEREALPGAQIVPIPSAAFHGTIRYGTAQHEDRVLTLAGAPGATAHIYSHGNPQRWAWLHADLGGGDVCEVVAATSTRPGLNRLPPMPFVRLRVGGRDWPPGDPLVHSARFIARIGLPTWTVLGMSGDRRIRIQVTQPAQRTIAVPYTDPDGSTAVCRNSERADAVISEQRRTAKGWEAERQWRCDATAHAEVGARE